LAPSPLDFDLPISQRVSSILVTLPGQMWSILCSARRQASGGLMDTEPRSRRSPLSNDERCIKSSQCHLTFEILFYTLSQEALRVFPHFLPSVIPFPVLYRPFITAFSSTSHSLKQSR
jgi:hypothetical protein